MKRLIFLVVVASALVACGDKSADSPKDVVKPVSAPNLTQTPDVGKVEQVAVNVTGTGVTPGAAVNDALKTAVQQVNGVKVDSTSVNVNSYLQATATLDVQTSEGKDSAKAAATLQSQVFADQIIAQSKGLISSFKVQKTTPPENGSALFLVDVEVKVAKFKAPADSGKIKIVVAPLRSDKSFFDVGGRQVPAREVLGAVRQQIIDTLSQTGRFTILDREFEGELQGEIDMISSGKAVNTDLAKLGQALTADLVWVGVMNDLSYTKNVRKLQTSDREMVGYSGGWSVSQRLINLATRQMMLANTLQGTPPAIAPTTLGAKFDESATLKNIQGEIVKKAAEAILLRTFPISVVERDGSSVVLSQGGQAFTESERYRIYLQGKEIKDPQTGQSLGNMEVLCCDVVINRVTPNLSYGTLENVKVDLASVQPGALQVREAISTAQVVKSRSSEAPVVSAQSVSTPDSEVPVAARAPVPASKSVSPSGQRKPGRSEDW